MDEWVKIDKETLINDSVDLDKETVYWPDRLLTKIIMNQIRLNELIEKLILKHYKEK